jgi:hypothetical protein
MGVRWREKVLPLMRDIVGLPERLHRRWESLARGNDIADNKLQSGAPVKDSGVFWHLYCLISQVWKLVLAGKVASES